MVITNTYTKTQHIEEIWKIMLTCRFVVDMQGKILCLVEEDDEIILLSRDGQKCCMDTKILR